MEQQAPGQDDRPEDPRNTMPLGKLVLEYLLLSVWLAALGLGLDAATGHPWDWSNHALMGAICGGFAFLLRLITRAIRRVRR